MCRKMN